MECVLDILKRLGEDKWYTLQFFDSQTIPITSEKFI